MWIPRCAVWRIKLFVKRAKALLLNVVIYVENAEIMFIRAKDGEKLKRKPIARLFICLLLLNDQESRVAVEETIWNQWVLELPRDRNRNGAHWKARRRCWSGKSSLSDEMTLDELTALVGCRNPVDNVEYHSHAADGCWTFEREGIATT